MNVKKYSTLKEMREQNPGNGAIGRVGNRLYIVVAGDIFKLEATKVKS